MKTTKPFHESVVDLINECKSKSAFEALCKLVLETTIPENHQRISSAITTSPFFTTLANSERVVKKLSEEAVSASSESDEEEEGTDNYHKNHFVTGVSDTRG